MIYKFTQFIYSYSLIVVIWKVEIASTEKAFNAVALHENLREKGYLLALSQIVSLSGSAMKPNAIRHAPLNGEQIVTVGEVPSQL